jgi:gamma-carbonic anhydrase
VRQAGDSFGDDVLVGPHAHLNGVRVGDGCFLATGAALFPGSVCPPGQHEQIWAIQESLDFPGTVYGVTRDTPATERMQRQAAWLAAHRDDRLID